MSKKTASVVKHPAKYSDQFLPIFAALVEKYNMYSDILDPFGGTGKIGRIKEYLRGGGYLVFNNDIEWEWSVQGYDNNCDHCVDYDAEQVEFSDMQFTIITSPTYGNGLASKYMKGLRHNYSIYLGKVVNSASTAGMGWGSTYKAKNERCIRHFYDICKEHMIINVKNFIRGGKEVDVVGWWLATCERNGFKLLEDVQVPVKSLKHGSNAAARVAVEHILVFKKVYPRCD